jgi:hypothetical protein
MSEVYNDLQYYNNLFHQDTTSIKEQASIINWSERKCYIYKHFIKNLTVEELDILKYSVVLIDHEIIAAISVHKVEMRLKMFEQLERINNARSPFEEIQVIFQENTTSNPLSSIPNNYWKTVKLYLEQLEIDSYPFNRKAINFLNSVSFNGYLNLTMPQRKWLDGLIEADRNRAETDHFFVNDFLIQKGFKDACKTIEQVWGNH